MAPLALDEPGMAARVGAVCVVRTGLTTLVARGDHVSCYFVSHAFVEHVIDSLNKFRSRYTRKISVSSVVGQLLERGAFLAKSLKI